MRFIKENLKALLLILIVIVSELIVRPFSNMPHSIISGVDYSYGDAAYFLLIQIGYVSFIPAIILYRTERDINTKGLYLGLVVWGFFQVLKELSLFFRLEIKLLIPYDCLKMDIMQIIFITFTVILTFFGYKRLNDISNPLNTRNSWILVQLQKIFKTKESNK